MNSYNSSSAWKAVPTKYELESSAQVMANICLIIEIIQEADFTKFYRTNQSNWSTKEEFVRGMQDYKKRLEKIGMTHTPVGQGYWDWCVRGALTERGMLWWSEDMPPDIVMDGTIALHFNLRSNPTSACTTCGNPTCQGASTCPFAKRKGKETQKGPYKSSKGADEATVCFSWRDTGHCRRGDDCRFAHPNNSKGKNWNKKKTEVSQE